MGNTIISQVTGGSLDISVASVTANKYINERSINTFLIHFLSVVKETGT